MCHRVKGNEWENTFKERKKKRERGIRYEIEIVKREKERKEIRNGDNYKKKEIRNGDNQEKKRERRMRYEKETKENEIRKREKR